MPRWRRWEARPMSNKHWQNYGAVEDSPWNPRLCAVPLADQLVLSAGDALRANAGLASSNLRV